jgi:hypothetical protein
MSLGGTSRYLTQGLFVSCQKELGALRGRLRLNPALPTDYGVPKSKIGILELAIAAANGIRWVKLGTRLNRALYFLGLLSNAPDFLVYFGRRRPPATLLSFALALKQREKERKAPHSSLRMENARVYQARLAKATLG